VSDRLALDRWPAEAAPCRALCTSAGRVPSSPARPSTATGDVRLPARDRKKKTAISQVTAALRLAMHPRGVAFTRARRLRWWQFPWMVAGVRRDERIDRRGSPRMRVVDGDERLPTPGQRLLREDGFHGTFRRAGAAVDAFVGLDHELAVRPHRCGRPGIRPRTTRPSDRDTARRRCTSRRDAIAVAIPDWRRVVAARPWCADTGYCRRPPASRACSRLKNISSRASRPWRSRCT